MIVNYSDYLMSHTVNVCIEVIIIALYPLYTIVIADPVLEATAGATASYKIECYAFYAKAVGRLGETQCTSYRWTESCYDVVMAVNTRTCGIEGSYASTGRQFYTYAMMSEILVTVIIVLVATGLLCIAAVYLYNAWWNELLLLSFLLQYLAAIAAVALTYFTSAAVKAATFQENNNIGQNVYIDAGLITAVMLTVTELLLSNTVTVWRNKSV